MVQFILKERHTFWRAVHVKVPTDNGFSTQTFDVEFLVLNNGERDEIVNQVEEGTIFPKDMQDEMLKRVVVSTKPIKMQTGPGKDDVELRDFDDELLDLLISVPYVAKAMMDEYAASIKGERRKN